MVGRCKLIEMKLDDRSCTTLESSPSSSALGTILRGLSNQVARRIPAGGTPRTSRPSYGNSCPLSTLVQLGADSYPAISAKCTQRAHHSSQGVGAQALMRSAGSAIWPYLVATTGATLSVAEGHRLLRKHSRAFLGPLSSVTQTGRLVLIGRWVLMETGVPESCRAG